MAKILIIDDEKGVCEEFSEILRDEDHEVDCALNAQEGFDKLKIRHYDIIFLDVLMPRIEGREALEKIRKMCDTPVVVMSGYLPANREKEVLQAGAFGSLRKPLELRQVFEFVNKAVESRKK